MLTDGKISGGVFSEATKASAYALTDRLQCLEAGGACVGMDADAIGGAMSSRETSHHQRRAAWQVF
jgi:hypothetical protein